MKQCSDCKTHKKADNCIMCAVKWRKQIEDVSRVLNDPIKDYQKLNEIARIINAVTEKKE